MSKEITKATGTGIIVPDGGFGMENILVADLRVPKILLMQQMSKFVTDEKVQARAGELRESYEGRKLGDGKTPVQIIPFYVTNSWTMRKEVNGKWEFDSIEERTPANAGRKFDENGKKNYKTLNIFCLIKNGNLSIPYMISMMSFSFKLAGQKFLNKGNLLKAEGKAYAHRVFNLSSQIVENDKGKFYAFSIDTATDDKGKEIATSPEEVSAAYEQYRMISTALREGKTIDTSDLHGEVGETSEERF